MPSAPAFQLAMVAYAVRDAMSLVVSAIYTTGLRIHSGSIFDRSQCIRTSLKSAAEHEAHIDALTSWTLNLWQ